MRADRLLSIIMLLQTHGKMTSLALAEALEVSQRTILRDVEALSMAGVPIYAEGGHGGGIALDEGYRTSLTGLKEAEALTLFVSTYARRLEDVGLGEAAEQSLLKLLAALPQQHQPAVEHIRQRLLIDPDWWWQDHAPLPFWDTLQQAVYEDRLIQVLYENHQGQVQERILEPYSLVAKSSLWYLVARRDQEFRTYRTARFRNVVLLNQHFQRLVDFDLPTYWRNHLQTFPTEVLQQYPFTLRLHQDRLPFLREFIPGYYTVAGDVENEWLTVKIHLESIDMAAMLVFGLGRQAAVIEPAELCAHVLQRAHEIIEQA